MWAADNIALTMCPVYPLYCNVINPTSLRITEVFHLLLGFAENWTVFGISTFIIAGVRITEGSENGDLDNRGSTVQSSQVCVWIMVISRDYRPSSVCDVIASNIPCMRRGFGHANVE